VLDIDLGGTLDFHEVQEGLKKMDHLQPRVHLSSDDYHRMTKGGSLCDQNGQLDPENFDCVFREELEAFMLGKIAKALDESFANERIVFDALLQGMKLLLVRSAVAQNKSRSTQNVSTFAPEMATGTLLNELRMLRKELNDAHNDILIIKKESVQRWNDNSLSESRKESTVSLPCKERQFENRSQEPTLDREAANGNHGVVICNVVKAQQNGAIDKLKAVNEKQSSSNAIAGLAANHDSNLYRNSQKHSSNERETRESQEFSARLHEINQYSGPGLEGSDDKSKLSKRLSNVDSAAGSRLEFKTVSALTAKHIALNRTETHDFIAQDAPSTVQSQRNSESGVRFNQHEMTCQSYITIPSSFQADVKCIQHHYNSDRVYESEISADFNLLEGKSNRSEQHSNLQKEHTYIQYAALASERHLLSVSKNICHGNSNCLLCFFPLQVHCLSYFMTHILTSVWSLEAP
jgi:hypothetical protein